MLRFYIWGRIIDWKTSPRDHAILESAYQKNSKPDKDERLNLVKLVDLGEKEVQVYRNPGKVSFHQLIAYTDMVPKSSTE